MVVEEGYNVLVAERETAFVVVGSWFVLEFLLSCQWNSPPPIRKLQLLTQKSFFHHHFRLIS